MNDITMLLQRMKSAASLATQGEWSYARSGFNSIVQVSVSLLRGGPARAVLCKLFRSEWRSELNTAHDAAFIALANPANVMTLIGALEARDKQIAELVAGRLNLQRTMGVYVHAYEEAKEQIAKDVEIKARLCRESNSLFDRLRAAEKRIAELEKATSEPVALRWRWNDKDAQWTYAPASKLPDFVAAGFSPENGVVIESLYTVPPALESRTVTEPQSDYFASLVAMARVSADKAMRKFPQPNYVLLKVAEEAGEVVQAGVHYAEKRMEWKQVEGEIVQLLAMLIRLVTEGDQINGITPPAAGIQVIEGEEQCGVE